MKKFQFAAGLLALGLMASCSSDAPELNPTPAPAPAEDVYATLAVRINSNTRAEGDSETSATDANALEGESTISSVQIFVTKTDGTTVFNGKTTLNEGLAQIAVTKGVYDTLAEENAKFNLYVLCNVDQTTLTTTAETDSEDAWKSNGFWMVNKEKVETGMTTDETNAEKKYVKANTAVTVSRLAVRYDFEKKASTALTADKEVNGNNKIKIAVDNYCLNNLGSKDYIFPHAGESATVFGTGNYATPTVTFTKAGKVGEMVYGSDAHKYSFGLGYKAEGSFANHTFVAFKGEMDLSESDFKHCTGTLYAYDHFMLGDETMLKAGTFDLGDATKNQMLKDIIATAAQATDFETALTASGLHAYKAESGKYYTYYLALVKTGNDCQIVRNNVYKMNIKSFSKLGIPADLTPDNYDEKLTSMYFQFNVSIQPWTMNEQDFEF